MLNLPSLTVAGVVETGAYPDALGLSGHWLYVANGASNTMSVFSGLKSPRTVGGVTYPFGVAVVQKTGSGAQRVNPIVVSASTQRAGEGSSTTVRARPAPFYGLPPA